MKRICVDMDEVLADTLSEHLRRYNEEYDEAISKEDLEGKVLWDIVSADRHERLRQYLHAEDFFADLEVVRDSQEVMKGLCVRFDVFIATAAMHVPNSLGPKYRWLQRHFPFIPPTHYVFCGDKSILLANYLIDDLPRNLDRFCGHGLLYSAPHNAHAQGHTRVNDWVEIAEFFAREPE